MTKVEELAGKLSYYIEGDDIGSGDVLLKDLLDAAHEETAAARSEGVAEGTEQERERIRNTAQVWMTGDPPPNDTWYGVDKKELDPSALAPTKEKP